MGDWRGYLYILNSFPYHTPSWIHSDDSFVLHISSPVSIVKHHEGQLPRARAATQASSFPLHGRKSAEGITCRSAPSGARFFDGKTNVSIIMITISNVCMIRYENDINIRCRSPVAGSFSDSIRSVVGKASSFQSTLYQTNDSSPPPNSISRGTTGSEYISKNLVQKSSYFLEVILQIVVCRNFVCEYPQPVRFIDPPSQEHHAARSVAQPGRPF